MMLKKVSILIAIFSLVTNITFGQDLKVSNISEFDNAIKTIKDGGTIILANGIWKDVKLNAHGNGTKEHPILIKAETAGEVILSGNSSLSIYGSYVTVSGLWFKDGKSMSKYVVQFRKNSKEFANNCRFTNSTISYFETASSDLKNHWVDIWGKNNRVDHNNFTGKTSAGTTLVVWLKGEEHIENNHLIDHNYFGSRPPLGMNTGETIRIGTSTNSMKSSNTTVEFNTFKNCDGEIEIISNKSANNVYRGNLFLESKGTLTLRHGDNALVENNIFFGNNISQTGGIRVINEGHTIRNNFMVGLAGDGFRGPIVIMNGVPNSPLNRYNQVKDADIQNNTIINCGPMTFGAGSDEERTLPPINTLFANNLISNTNAGEILHVEDDISGIKFSGNIVDSEAEVETQYFTKAAIDWALLKSLPMPTNSNEALKVVSTVKSPSMDITNTEREPYVAGAFNLSNTKIPTAITIRTGPHWQPNIVAPKVKQVSEEITVEPGLETLRKAISKSKDGTILKLKAGTYLLEKGIQVNKNIKVIGDATGETLIIADKILPKPLTYVFRVNEGGRLHLENLIIDGSNKDPLKYALVSPNDDEGNAYSIFADNCTFKNFTNTNGGSIFKAYRGTKADTLSFTNSTFKDSYRGLNLSYDKDNTGFYNAEVIIIKNSAFDNITEAAVNYVRTIPNIEIPGGKLIVDHCVFNNVYNEEKGKILRTNGIHEVDISNSVFINSYLIKNPIQLSGNNNTIDNCLFNDIGSLKAVKGAKETNIIYKNPRWKNSQLFVPSKKSPLLKENNGFETIGLQYDK